MVNCCGTQKELRIVMIGVTGSGKTSLLKAISGEMMGEKGYQKPIPTHGFDIKNITFEGQLLNV